MRIIDPMPRQLSVIEQRVIAEIRAMDAECCLDSLAFLEAQAKCFPLHHAPLLRLVTEGKA